MRQYQVPQFINVEDQIIGPLTLKQFLYLLAGIGTAMLARAIFIPIIGYIIGFFALVLSGALAFLKISGVPFPKIIMGALSYFTKPHLYIWKQEMPSEKKPEKSNDVTALPKISEISESKLEDLAWSLDIKEHMKERQ